MYFLLEKVDFHCYVSLPEGICRAFVFGVAFVQKGSFWRCRPKNGDVCWVGVMGCETNLYDVVLKISWDVSEYAKNTVSEWNMFSCSSYKILICTTTNTKRKTSNYHHVLPLPGVWEKAGGLLAYCQFLLSSLGDAWFVQNPSWQQWMWHRIDTSGRNTRSEGGVCAATWLEDQPS